MWGYLVYWGSYRGKQFDVIGLNKQTQMERKERSYMENKNSSGTSMNPSDTPEKGVTGPSQNLPGPIMEVQDEPRSE